MRKCGLFCRPMSVRLSVAFVYCIQTAEDIDQLLSQPGSPTILVFLDSMHRCQIPRKPLQRVGLKSPFTSETVREFHGCYGMFIGCHRWRIDRCRFRWRWVALKGGTRGVIFFRQILLTLVGPTVWPRTTTFGRKTHVGSGVFLGGQPRHSPWMSGTIRIRGSFCCSKTEE